MRIDNRHIVATLLILSMGLLSILVPGGPIETRGFSHLDPFILGAFNTFLTSLGMASILLVYFVLHNRKWALNTATVCGVFYFLVYLLDLGKIFPVSPDPMPPALLLIEITGSIVSFPLMLFSIRGARHSANTRQADNEPALFTTKSAYWLVLMMITGIGIIIFATNSAMHS